MKRQPNWPAFLLFAAILLGGLVRFMPAAVTHFPINDGGMFFDMTRDLQENHYRLPDTTRYNGLDLPYAYPPFGFYLASLLADVGRIPLLDVFLWLPPFLATLTIPAFYLLARSMLADSLRAALATLFFALTPGSYNWPIMGGGVTRAAGISFMFLAVLFVLRLFQESRLKLLLPAILFCSLAVLSHPEVAVQTAGVCALLWLFYGRTWRSTLHAFLVALGVFLLTAPWWGTVVAQHGLAPFLSALQTGEHASVDWLFLPDRLFGSSEFLPLLLILRLTGFVYAFLKKQFIFIALIFLPALIDPRSAAMIAQLSLTMLSALACLDAFPALIQKIRGGNLNPISSPRAGVAVLSILIFNLFLECGLINFRLINTTLTAGEREAMTWISRNISPPKNFLLVTGITYSMSDPVQEWFPTLTGLHSQSTLQGLEWSLGGDFIARLNDLAELQACSDLACVGAWSARTGVSYDILWVTRPSPINVSASPALQSLSDSLRNSKTHALTYESDSVLLFTRIDK
jgi:hypothetical protein